MTVIVFGATGRCGGHIVRLALARGHQVTAVARMSSSSVYHPPPGAAVAEGDVLDPAFVEAAVRSHDAVLSALGMRYAHPWAKRQSPDDFTSCATGHILNGMQKAGLGRVGVISAGGVGDSRPVLNWPMRFLVRTSNVGIAYANLERVEAALRASAFDWQAVRPTTLRNSRATGQPRLTNSYPATASIACEDVATFMLDELAKPTYTQRTPLIRS